MAPAPLLLQRERETRVTLVAHIEASTRQRERALTFDLWVISTSVLLRFWVHCGSRLPAHSSHGDRWDLVDNVYRLHDGGGAN